MVLSGLDGRQHHEIGMAPPVEPGSWIASRALEGRGKRLHVDRSPARSLATKFQFEPLLDRVRRHQKCVCMEKGRRQPPAKNPQIVRREILRIVQRKEVVNHEHIAEVVPFLKPIEEDRAFEQVLGNVEINRAARNAQRCVVEDAAPGLAEEPPDLGSPRLAKLPTGLLQVWIGRRCEPLGNCGASRARRLCRVGYPQRSGQGDKLAGLFDGIEMRARQSVVNPCSHSARTGKMRGVGQIDSVDAGRRQLGQS